MILEDLNLEDHCRLQGETEAALFDSAAGAALARYLDTAGASIRKPGLEWALIGLLDRSAPELPPGLSESWPEERIEMPSGAALRFAVIQRTPEDRSSALPPGLSRRPPLAGPHKELLARAWLHRPDTPALADPEPRRGFARWLARHPPAVGGCLLAAAAADDRALVDELTPRWLSCGLLHPGAPAEVARASRRPALADPARRALRIVVGRFFRDDGSLAELLEPALALGDAESAATLGETLFARSADPSLRRRALAVRLAALGEARRGAQLADEYRRRWLPTGWAYPRPERLLYLFQELGADDLERHLLGHVEVSDETPDWVLLTRETLEAPSPGPEQLGAWEKLHAAHPKDERVLVGATRAVLRRPRPVRKEWSERLGLSARWRQLAGLDRYRWLAGAFLVLLHTEKEDRIAEFENRLTEAPLDLPAVRRAARAYLAALRRSRRWRRLAEIEARRPEMLLHACPFAERELLRTLARLSELPGDRRAERRWCEGWERLIGLPLDSSEVVEVLDHFVNLRRELERHGHLRHEQALFADVTLQLLRRVRAEAEALLARHPGRAGELQELRERLAHAGPEATFRILQQLSTTVSPEAPGRGSSEAVRPPKEDPLCKPPSSPERSPAC